MHGLRTVAILKKMWRLWLTSFTLRTGLCASFAYYSSHGWPWPPPSLGGWLHVTWDCVCELPHLFSACFFGPHLLVAAGVEGSDSATLPTAHWCMVSMDGDDWQVGMECGGLQLNEKLILFYLSVNKCISLGTPSYSSIILFIWN